MILLLVAFPLSARAQEPECEALTPEELTGRVSVARQALFYEEMDTFTAVAQELEAQIPCLTAVPSPEIWAQHLVSLSVAAFAENRDWQPPLASALRVHPTVDRGVGANHPIAQWTPPPEEGVGQSAVPPGVVVYVDGRQVSFVPELRGPHLVQVERDGLLRSAFVVDGEIPAEWLPAPAVESPIPAPPSGPTPTWFALFAGLGWGAGAQRVQDPGDFLSDAGAGHPYAGVGLLGQLSIAGPVGLTAEGTAQLTESPLVSTWAGGVGVVTETMAVTAGVALATGSVRVADADLSWVAAAPGLTGALATGTLDARVQLAAGPALFRVGGDAGLQLGAGRLAPRVGLRGGWSRAGLEQEASGRHVDVSGWEAVATFGLRLGS